MAEDEERPLSTVIPHLVAAIVCDVAVADPTTNKKSLNGVFDRLSVGKFPAKRPVSLYFKITDAEGNYDLDIRHVQSDTGKILAKVQAQGGLKVKDRLVRLTPGEFRHPLKAGPPPGGQDQAEPGPSPSRELRPRRAKAASLKI